MSTAFSCLKFKQNFKFMTFMTVSKTHFAKIPPVLASHSDQQGVIPNRRLFSNALSVACQHTTNRGDSRFFMERQKLRTPRRIEDALSGWVLSVTNRRGFLKQKHGNQNETRNNPSMLQVRNCPCLSDGNDHGTARRCCPELLTMFDDVCGEKTWYSLLTMIENDL